MKPVITICLTRETDAVALWPCEFVTETLKAIVPASGGLVQEIMPVAAL